ncbi:cell division cycle 14 [Anaeramoeba flamelloides]|uniref:Cell division cycle 14 n=1 Tax=Anaeramoeba flamelloides TaxID=1746091 RepID=A0ABQ8ZBE6_9EUKA|nr:cell division cycle 14 [Anaeramoeba flamelloides]
MNNQKEIAELIKKKLFFYCSPSTQTKFSKGEIHFTVDKTFIYEPFFGDFGPFKLSLLVKFYRLLRDKIDKAKHNKKKYFFYSNSNKKTRSNSAVLICSFLMVYCSMSAKEAYSKISHFKTFFPFRDASPLVSSYDLTVLDVLEGLEKGIQNNWVNFETFDIQWYEKHEQVVNGDLNWIIPDKILAFCSPTPDLKNGSGSDSGSGSGSDSENKKTKEKKSKKKNKVNNENEKKNKRKSDNESDSRSEKENENEKERDNEDEKKKKKEEIWSWFRSETDTDSDSDSDETVSESDSAKDNVEDLDDFGYGWSVSKYAEYFDNYNVTCVIRLNQPIYNKKPFLKKGMSHYDLHFTDGSVPTEKLLDKFLKIAENQKEADKKRKRVMAIHCKAGLGRTGVMIGSHLIKNYNFTAKQAIAWMRLCRPGSVIGSQQHYLTKIEKKYNKKTKETQDQNRLLLKPKKSPQPRKVKRNQNKEQIPKIKEKKNL